MTALRPERESAASYGQEPYEGYASFEGYEASGSFEASGALWTPGATKLKNSRQLQRKRMPDLPPGLILNRDHHAADSI